MMRTRERASSRGKNYLPKNDACPIPNPFEKTTASETSHPMTTRKAYKGCNMIHDSETSSSEEEEEISSATSGTDELTVGRKLVTTANANAKARFEAIQNSAESLKKQAVNLSKDSPFTSSTPYQSHTPSEIPDFLSGEEITSKKKKTPYWPASSNRYSKLYSSVSIKDKTKLRLNQYSPIHNANKSLKELDDPTPKQVTFVLPTSSFSSSEKENESVEKQIDEPADHNTSIASSGFGDDLISAEGQDDLFTDIQMASQGILNSTENLNTQEEEMEGVENCEVENATTPVNEKFGVIQGVAQIARTGQQTVCFEPVNKGWQQHTNTILKRDKVILDNIKWTDCQFCVGTEEKIFSCHRVYLAKTSEAFEDMIYNNNHDRVNRFCLPDITPQSFATLLQYIYEGSVKLGKFSEVCDVLYAAKKYRMPSDFIQMCQANLWAHIFPDNKWAALKFAHENNEPHLFETALKAINGSFICEEFLNVTQTLLTHIVSSEIVHVNARSESELFSNCVQWASRYTQRNQLPPDRTVLRKLLDPIIKQIRFLIMSPNEFFGTKRIDILSDNEQLRIVRYLIEPKPSALPDFVSPKVRNEVDESFFVYGIEKKDSIINFATYANTFNFFSTVAFEINQATNLKSISIVQIPTQVKNEPNETYTENISVIVKDSEGTLLNVSTICGQVNYNSIINGVLSAPVDLTKLINKSIVVKVIFHVTGHYPLKKALNHELLVSYSDGITFYNQDDSFIHLVGCNP